MENVIIIGMGCAGLTAAIYAARANLNPLVITGSEEEGGQLMLTTAVENYPGFPDGVQGPDLIALMKAQAEKFGTKFVSARVTSFAAENGMFNAQAGEQAFQSKTVIIATGASAKWIGLESETKYRGRGVSSCATCDGYFYKDKEVLVVGGGDSACEEALFLTKFVTKVSIIHRRDKLRASKIMQDRVLANPKIKLVWNSEVGEVLGDGKKVTGVAVKDTIAGKIQHVSCDGIFVAIGHEPNTSIFKGLINLDEKGFVITDRRTRTNVPGVFACGDVQDHIYKQAITAAGTGCQAAMEAEKYLESLEAERK